MANHKRKRPKNRRAGCLMCKPWKMNGFSKDQFESARFSDARRRYFAKAEIREESRGLRNSKELVHVP